MSSNLPDNGNSRYNKYELVKRLFYETFNELLDSLNLYELKQKPPSFRITILKEVRGEYNQQMHEVRMDEEFVKRTVYELKEVEKDIKNLEELKEFLPKDTYERLVKSFQNLLENHPYYRELKRTSIHEGIHVIRYSLFPETKEEQYVVRSKVEEALSTLGEAIFLDMDEEKIIRYIIEYKASTKNMENESILRYSIIYALKNFDELSEDVRKIKETGILEDVMKYHEFIISRSQGYRLGLLAALSIKDLPKEEKIKIFKDLISEKNLERLLYKLEDMAMKGIGSTPNLKEELKKHGYRLEDVYSFSKKDKKSNSYSMITYLLFAILTFTFLYLYFFTINTTGFFFMNISNISLNFLSIILLIPFMILILIAKNFRRLEKLQSKKR